MLRNHGQDYVKQKIVRKILGEKPPEHVFTAKKMRDNNDNNQYFKVVNKNGISVLYVNVDPPTCKRPGFEHRAVTDQRIRDHEKGLQGKCDSCQRVTDFRNKYMSLFKVEVREGEIRCECKDFWHSKVCPEALLFADVCEYHEEPDFVPLDNLTAAPKAVKKGKCRIKVISCFCCSHLLA